MSDFITFIAVNAEIIIALCALVISVISILVAYLTLKTQNQHSRLSVRPIGRIGYHTDPGYIEIYVANDGVGPLLCKQLRVYKSKDDIKHSFEGLLPLSEEQKRLMNLSLASRKNFAIPAGERFVLLEARVKERGSEEGNAVRDLIKESLKQITLEFEYSDIYEQVMPIKRKDTWR